MKVNILLLWLSIPIFLTAQSSEMDSLKKQILLANSSADKLEAIFKLSDHFESIEVDEFTKYAHQAKSLAKNTDLPLYEVQADFVLGLSFVKRSIFDSAIIVLSSCKEAFRNNLGYTEFVPKIYRQLNNLFGRQRMPEKMIENSIELLGMAEKVNDTFGIYMAKMGIANGKNHLELLEDAKKLYVECTKMAPAKIYPHVYTNLGLLMYKQQKFDSCLQFLNEALVISDRSKNYTQMATTYFMMGNAKGDQGKITEAEGYYQKGIAMRKIVGDPFFVVTDMANLAMFYYDQKEYQKGIEICIESIETGNTYNINNLDAYTNLSKLYEANHQYDKAFEISKIQIKLKDSLYKASSADAMAEMETRYEVQKKENTIIKQSLDITKRNNQLMGLGGLLIFSTIGGYIYLQNRKKMAQLKLHELELEQQERATKAILQAEDNERKKIADELHDDVAQKLVAAKMNLQALAYNDQNEMIVDPKTFEKVSVLISDSANGIRELSHALMPGTILYSGLSDAIHELVNKSTNTKFDINLQIGGDLNSLEESKSIMVYRICQELIQNTLKHADSKKMKLNLDLKDSYLKILSGDDGKGFDENFEVHNLRSLNSRVRFLKGTIEIKRDINTKSNIYIEIPV